VPEHRISRQWKAFFCGSGGAAHAFIFSAYCELFKATAIYWREARLARASPGSGRAGAKAPTVPVPPSY